MIPSGCFQGSRTERGFTEKRGTASGTFGVVADQNAPEFHDRFSIHPRSAGFCRDLLLEMAERFPRGEEEIEGLSDWECIQKVESLRRCEVGLMKSLQGATRAAKGTAARLALLCEALIPLQAEQLANESELFLAIDHSA
jgi:hypothetical protein